MYNFLPKFGWKSTENWPIFGPKKPAGLSGFEDRASGGLGPPKKPLGRAGFGLSPRPATSLNITFFSNSYFYIANLIKKSYHYTEFLYMCVLCQIE